MRSNKSRVLEMLDRANEPYSIYLEAIVEVGSTVHGISAGNDDTDYTVVWTEPFSRLMRMSSRHHTHMLRTQPEGTPSGPGDIDLQVYTMRKYVSLAVAGNPSILLPLFVPDKQCPVMSTRWRESREEIARMAWTKKAGHAFLGYLDSQLSRWTGHQGRRRVKRAELVEAHGYDTKYAAHAIRLGVQGIEFLTNGRINVPMEDPMRTWLKEIRAGEIAEEHALTMAGSTRERLAIALDKSWLPERPDKYDVDEFLYDWHRRML